MSPEQVFAVARTALKNSHVFQLLPADAIENLASSARYEFFAEPTKLMSRGEKANELRYVVSGYIVGKGHTPEGRETELIPYGVGQWMTWLGTFANGTMSQDYWSSSNAAFLSFPNESVLRYSKCCPEIYQPMLEEVGHRFRTALNWIWTTNLSRSEIRAARYLILLSRPSNAPSRSEIVVSQASLARTLGTSRQTLNRLLKNIEERGLIEIGYRAIRILDLQGLRSFAEQDGPLLDNGKKSN